MKKKRSICIKSLIGISATLTFVQITSFIFGATVISLNKEMKKKCSIRSLFFITIATQTNDQLILWLRKFSMNISRKEIKMKFKHTARRWSQLLMLKSYVLLEEKEIFFNTFFLVFHFLLSVCYVDYKDTARSHKIWNVFVWHASEYRFIWRCVLFSLTTFFFFFIKSQQFNKHFYLRI